MMTGSTRLKVKAILHDGEIKYYRPVAVKEFIAKNEGEMVDVIIEKHDPDLTKNQQGYYRAINRFLAEETETFKGWEEEEIHNYAVTTCGTEEIVKYIGEKPYTLYFRLSMRSATKSQARAFIDKWIRHLTINLHITPPPPESL